MTEEALEDGGKPEDNETRASLPANAETDPVAPPEDKMDEGLADAEAADSIFEFRHGSLQLPDATAFDMAAGDKDKRLLDKLTGDPAFVVVSNNTEEEKDQIRTWVQAHLNGLARAPRLKELVVSNGDHLSEKRLIGDLLAEFKPAQLDPLETGIRHFAVVSMDRRKLALSPEEMPEQIKALAQAEMSVLVLLGEDVWLEQRVSDVCHWRPDFEPLWWHGYFARVTPQAHEPRAEWLDGVLNEISEQREMTQGLLAKPEGRAELRRLLLNAQPETPDLSPAKAAQWLLARLARQDANFTDLETLVGRVFDNDGGDAFSLAELRAANKIEEPHATVMFTLWASIMGTPGEGTKQAWFHGTLIYLLELMEEKEKQELAAIKADKSLSKKKRDKKKSKLATPATDLLKHFSDDIWNLHRVLKIESFTDKHGVPRLKFADARMVKLLGDYFADRGRGYLSKRRRLVLDRSVPLLHEDENVNRVAQFLMIRDYAQRGSLASAEVRAQIVEDLLKCVDDDDTPKLTRGPRRIADFVVYWFNSLLDTQGDTKKLEAEFQGLTTDILKALADNQDGRLRLHGFYGFFRRLTFERDNLLDVSAVFKHAAFGNKWDLQLALLDFVEGEQKKRFKGHIQYRLFLFICQTLPLRRPLDGDNQAAFQQTNWFIAQLALLVLPGMVNRLQYEDYQPQDDPDTYSDRAMAQVLTAKDGIEDFVRVLVSREISKELSRLLGDWIQRMIAREERDKAAGDSSEWKRFLADSERWRSDREKIRIETMFISLITTMPVKLADEDELSPEDRRKVLDAHYDALQHQIREALPQPTPQELMDMDEAAREEALLMVRGFPVWVLAELFVALKCSGRDALAQRLCVAIGEHLDRKTAHALIKDVRSTQAELLRAFASTLKLAFRNEQLSREEWQERYDFLLKKRGNVAAFSLQ